MDRNFSRALSAVLEYEGGYSNNPKDPGGPTNLGVTLANFRAFVKPDGTIDDLKKLSREQAGVVYRRNYWDVVMGASLPDGVDLVVFDFAVNSGPNRASKFLQECVGAEQDGKIGPATIKAVQSKPTLSLIDRYCDRRLKFLQGLNTFSSFGKGWTARVSKVRLLAHQLAAQKVDAPTVIVKDVVQQVEKEVPVEVKGPAGKGVADAATGAGVGAASLGGVLQTLQEQLTPFSMAGGWIGKLVVILIIAGAVMTIGGLAYRWWAMRKKATKVAELNAPTVQA